MSVACEASAAAAAIAEQAIFFVECPSSKMRDVDEGQRTLTVTRQQQRRAQTPNARTTAIIDADRRSWTRNTAARAQTQGVLSAGTAFASRT
jgi:hypothetical protein